MADQLITSLLYGKNPVPKKARPLKDRLKLPIGIGILLAIVGVSIYTFINYREEGSVREFLRLIQAGDFDAAYANWDRNESYQMKQFLEDWGRGGFFTKGMTAAKVVTSHKRGPAVIVQVAIAPYPKPIKLRVDRQTLRVSFAPEVR